MYKIQFWICFIGLYVLRILTTRIPYLNTFSQVQNALELLSIWRCGDRYYQIFHILPHIRALSGMNKNSKILYVGIQWYQRLEVKVLNHYFTDITFIDIDAHNEKYTYGHCFVCADISKISHVYPSEYFDCVIISGLFYHYGLDKDFTNNTVKQVAHILKPAGLFITGVHTVFAPQKMATEPNIITYFKPEKLNNKACHKVYETLKSHKKTEHWYYFEIFRKKI